MKVEAKSLEEASGGGHLRGECESGRAEQAEEDLLRSAVEEKASQMERRNRRRPRQPGGGVFCPLFFGECCAPGSNIQARSPLGDALASTPSL